MTVFKRKAYNPFIVPFILIIPLKQSKNIKIKAYKAIICLLFYIEINWSLALREKQTKTEAARSNTG
jgi:hypothetical protein